MESSSLTATQLQPTDLPESKPIINPPRLSPSPIPSTHVTAVDAASVVPVVATPPDPNAIPIDPPHGSPPPPPGQLMPDVAVAEEASPMKVSTPPPSTPSPVPGAPVPADAFPTEQPTPSETTNAIEDGFGAGDMIGADPDFKSEDPMFGDAVFPTEADGDLVMNDHDHDDDGPNGFSANGIQTTDSPHVVYPNSPGSLATYAQQENGDIDGPPPAKRMKLDSPGANGLTEDSPGYALSMESPVAPTAPWARPMTQPQNKFALSVVRSMKKNKDAVPFLIPVDPVALNIPHYPTIITNPMDLSTVEKKLGGGGQKPDGPQYPRYANVEEFVHDVRLIVNNCVTFNGPEHPVTQMAKRLEEAFDKQMKNMPTADDVKPPQMKPVVKKVAPVRRASTTTGPAPRREDSFSQSARPKREIPPPREQPHAAEPRRPITKKRFPKRNDGTTEQLRFCHKLINELYRPKYSNFAYPFYEPVDSIKLDIPHYHKIVKKPMDMATMLTKLNNGDYPDARAFHADFKLMIKNCFAFNPAGTPVHQAGIELNEVFDEKWNGLPSLYGETDDEGAEEEDSENEQNNAVMLMEAQIQSLHNALNQIKKQASKQKSGKEKPPKPSTSSVPKPPKPASTKPNHAAGGGGGGAFKKKKKASHDDEEALTFEQKKQLSETIQTLDGGRLEKVLEIIDEVYPEIRETSEEIELDIDSLPSHVLIRLYNFVIRPNKPRVGRPPNGTSSSKVAASSSGIDRKRKSMNEDEESAKIRQLEETLARLKSGQYGAGDVALAQTTTAGAGDDSGDSDSDSSNSSGSDSE